jgi:uncharacterized protein (DUF2141 family)
MKNFLRSSALVVAIASSSHASAVELTVDVSDLRTTQGALMVAVIDSAAGWDDSSKAVARRKLSPEQTTVELTFPDLKPGQYAVQVMHDENGNGKLDTNFLGLPVEGYGFSNNPQVMRRPHFDEARFELGSENSSIQIRLR